MNKKMTCLARGAKWGGSANSAAQLLSESKEAKARLPNPAALVRSISRRESTCVNWRQQFMATLRVAASLGRLHFVVKRSFDVDKFVS